MTDNSVRNIPTPARTPGMSRAEFLRRVLIVVAVVTLTVAGVTIFVRAYDIFLLFFLAVLLAILLRGTSNLLASQTKIGTGWALGIIVFVLLALIVGGLYAVGTMIVGQFNHLATQLPASLDQARNYLSHHEWGRQILNYTPSAERLVAGKPGESATRVTTFFSTTLGIIGNLLVLVFLTLYLAASAQMYRNGLVSLIPPQHRERGEEVLNSLGYHLWWWLVGRAVAMLAVAIICGVGLWLIGVPQFLVLGLLAGLLTAVPFFGPITAMVPGLLLAFMQGPVTVLWAGGVYLLAQAIENYVLTPLIQQKTVQLPPALTIIAVALGGALFGVFGLIVASPLMVAGMVAVKMIYVENVLGENMKVPGAEAGVPN